MANSDNCGYCKTLQQQISSEKKVFSRKLTIIEALKELLNTRNNLFLNGVKQNIRDLRIQLDSEKQEIRNQLVFAINTTKKLFGERQVLKDKLDASEKEVANLQFILDQSNAQIKTLERENINLKVKEKEVKKKKCKKGKENDWLECYPMKSDSVASPDEGLDLSDGISSISSPFSEISYECSDKPAIKLLCHPPPLELCEHCLKIIKNQHVCDRAIVPLEVSSLQPRSTFVPPTNNQTSSKLSHITKEPSSNSNSTDETHSNVPRRSYSNPRKKSYKNDDASDKFNDVNKLLQSFDDAISSASELDDRLSTISELDDRLSSISKLEDYCNYKAQLNNFTNEPASNVSLPSRSDNISQLPSISDSSNPLLTRFTNDIIAYTSNSLISCKEESKCTKSTEISENNSSTSHHAPLSIEDCRTDSLSTSKTSNLNMPFIGGDGYDFDTYIDNNLNDSCFRNGDHFNFDSLDNSVLDNSDNLIEMSRQLNSGKSVVSNSQLNSINSKSVFDKSIQDNLVPEPNINEARTNLDQDKIEISNGSVTKLNKEFEQSTGIEESVPSISLSDVFEVLKDKTSFILESDLGISDSETLNKTTGGNGIISDEVLCQINPNNSLVVKEKNGHSISSVECSLPCENTDLSNEVNKNTPVDILKDDLASNEIDEFQTVPIYSSKKRISRCFNSITYQAHSNKEDEESLAHSNNHNKLESKNVATNVKDTRPVDSTIDLVNKRKDNFPQNLDLSFSDSEINLSGGENDLSSSDELFLKSGQENVENKFLNYTFPEKKSTTDNHVLGIGMDNNPFGPNQITTKVKCEEKCIKTPQKRNIPSKDSRKRKSIDSDSSPDMLKIKNEMVINFNMVSPIKSRKMDEMFNNKKSLQVKPLSIGSDIELNLEKDHSVNDASIISNCKTYKKFKSSKNKCMTTKVECDSIKPIECGEIKSETVVNEKLVKTNKEEAIEKQYIFDYELREIGLLQNLEDLSYIKDEHDIKCKSDCDENFQNNSDSELSDIVNSMCKIPYILSPLSDQSEDCFISPVKKYPKIEFILPVDTLGPLNAESLKIPPLECNSSCQPSFESISNTSPSLQGDRCYEPLVNDNLENASNHLLLSNDSNNISDCEASKTISPLLINSIGELPSESSSITVSPLPTNSSCEPPSRNTSKTVSPLPTNSSCEPPFRNTSKTVSPLLTISSYEPPSKNTSKSVSPLPTNSSCEPTFKDTSKTISPLQANSCEPHSESTSETISPLLTNRSCELPSNNASKTVFLLPANSCETSLKITSKTVIPLPTNSSCELPSENTSKTISPLVNCSGPPSNSTSEIISPLLTNRSCELPSNNASKIGFLLSANSCEPSSKTTSKTVSPLPVRSCDPQTVNTSKTTEFQVDKCFGTSVKDTLKNNSSSLSNDCYDLSALNTSKTFYSLLANNSCDPSSKSTPKATFSSVNHCSEPFAKNMNETNGNCKPSDNRISTFASPLLVPSTKRCQILSKKVSSQIDGVSLTLQEKSKKSISSAEFIFPSKNMGDMNNPGDILKDDLSSNDIDESQIIPIYSPKKRISRYLSSSTNHRNLVKKDIISVVSSSKSSCKSISKTSSNSSKIISVPTNGVSGPNSSGSNSPIQAVNRKSTLNTSVPEILIQRRLVDYSSDSSQSDDSENLTLEDKVKSNHYSLRCRQNSKKPETSVKETSDIKCERISNSEVFRNKKLDCEMNSTESQPNNIDCFVVPLKPLKRISLKRRDSEEGFVSSYDLRSRSKKNMPKNIKSSSKQQPSESTFLKPHPVKLRKAKESTDCDSFLTFLSRIRGEYVCPSRLSELPHSPKGDIFEEANDGLHLGDDSKIKLSRKEKKALKKKLKKLAVNHDKSKVKIEPLSSFNDNLIISNHPIKLNQELINKADEAIEEKISDGYVNRKTEDSSQRITKVEFLMKNQLELSLSSQDFSSSTHEVNGKSIKEQVDEKINNRCINIDKQDCGQNLTSKYVCNASNALTNDGKQQIIKILAGSEKESLVFDELNRLNNSSKSIDELMMNFESSDNEDMVLNRPSIKTAGCDESDFKCMNYVTKDDDKNTSEARQSQYTDLPNNLSITSKDTSIVCDSDSSDFSLMHSNVDSNISVAGDATDETIVASCSNIAICLDDCGNIELEDKINVVSQSNKFMNETSKVCADEDMNETKNKDSIICENLSKPLQNNDESMCLNDQFTKLEVVKNSNDDSILCNPSLIDPTTSLVESSCLVVTKSENPVSYSKVKNKKIKKAISNKKVDVRKANISSSSKKFDLKSRLRKYSHNIKITFNHVSLKSILSEIKLDHNYFLKGFSSQTQVENARESSRESLQEEQTFDYPFLFDSLDSDDVEPLPNAVYENQYGDYADSNTLIDLSGNPDDVILPTTRNDSDKSQGIAEKLISSDPSKLSSSFVSADRSNISDLNPPCQNLQKQKVHLNESCANQDCVQDSSDFQLNANKSETKDSLNTGREILEFCSKASICKTETDQLEPNGVTSEEALTLIEDLLNSPLSPDMDEMCIDETYIDSLVVECSDNTAFDEDNNINLDFVLKDANLSPSRKDANIGEDLVNINGLKPGTVEIGKTTIDVKSSNTVSNLIKNNSTSEGDSFKVNRLPPSHKSMACFGKLVDLQYMRKSNRNIGKIDNEFNYLRPNFRKNIPEDNSDIISSYDTDSSDESTNEFEDTFDNHMLSLQNISGEVKSSGAGDENNTCLPSCFSLQSDISVHQENSNNGFSIMDPQLLNFNFYTKVDELQMPSEPNSDHSSKENSFIISKGNLSEDVQTKKKSYDDSWNTSLRYQPKPVRSDSEMITCKSNAFQSSLEYWHDYACLNPKPKRYNTTTTKDLSLLESCITEIIYANLEDNMLKKIQAISSKIDHIDCGHIADIIVDAVYMDSGEPDLRYTPPAPPLTPLQRRLLMLLSILANGNEEYYLTVLKALEEPVVSFVDKYDITKLSNLVQFHTALCKHLGLLSRSRAFLYDILYCKGQKIYPLVFSMIPLWIEILPSSEDSQDCLLTQTIVYILTHYVPHHQKSENASYHASLKQFLDDVYEYNKPGLTRDTLCNKLICNINLSGANLALVLLCKREEWEWASKIMENKIHPIINSWLLGQLDEETATQSVLCLGRVVRGYPMNVACNSIKRSRDLLEEVLNHQKSIDVTEAAVNSICMLRRHDLFSCSMIFTKWRPADGRITKNMADNIKTVLSAKQLTYWKKFLCRYN